MSAPFLSNGWRRKGQLLVSVLYLLSNLGDAFMPESAWSFVLTNQFLIVPFFFSSSQQDLTPAIPTVDHILCTIVRCASHSKNCSTADQATCEFRSCFSISAGGAAVMGQRTVADRGKGPENHLQWKPRLASWLCVHARLYGLAMSLTSGKPSVIQRVPGIKYPNNVCWVVSSHGLT